MFGNNSLFSQENPATNYVREAVFPYLPPKVNLMHLGPNGKLHPDDIIAQVKQRFADIDAHPSFEPPDGKNYCQVFEDVSIEVKENNSKVVKLVKIKSFTVIRLIHPVTRQPKYFAIYFGAKDKKCLGEGGYGKVKLMQDLETGEWYALKIRKYKPDATEYDDDDRMSALQEVLNLEFVEQGIGSVEKRCKQDPDYLKRMIGMKLAQGLNLYKFTKSNPVMHTCKWLELAISLANNVATLHQKNALHRDLKPDNYIYDKATGQTTLIDYGFMVSKLIHRDKFSYGTPGFMSPEVECYDYSMESEIYALGKTLACVLGFANWGFCNVTFYNKNSEEYLNNTRVPPEFRRAIYKFLKRMIDDDPDDRPGIQEVITFFTDLRDSHIDVLAKKRKIGILNIHEFVSGSSEQEKLLAAVLKNMDEVWVTDIDQKYKNAYPQFRRVLEELDVPVGTRVFYSPARPASTMFLSTYIDMVRHIPALMGKKSENHSYFFVTGENFPETYLDPLQKAKICPLKVAPDKLIEQYSAEITSHVHKHYLIDEQLAYVKKHFQRKMEKYRKIIDASTAAQTPDWAAVKRFNLIRCTLDELTRLHAGRKLNHPMLCWKLNDLREAIYKTGTEALKVVNEREQFYLGMGVR